jgi:hypothetical protein
MDTPPLFMPVNWVDGMKINKTHLTAERNALLQHSIFAAGSHITPVNYGLLPAAAGGQPGCQLQVTTDNQQHVQVRLVSCRAVTPGGAVITIHEASGAGMLLTVKVPGLSVPFAELKNKSTVFYVILTVNPYDRLPAGQADMAEIPPRLPCTTPQYTLSLLPQEELSGQAAGLYQLTLSRLLITENRVQIDEEYIPPCVTAGSHPDLQDVYMGLDEFMGKMELYALQINQKIQQKKQTNEMAVIVQRICDHLLQHQNMHFAYLKWVALHQPPAVMLALTASMARLIKNTLDMYVNAGKEDLMNYFVEWCEVSQGALETAITDLSNHQYSHEDINAAVIKVRAFTKIVSALFYKLSRLDYIGKKKEAAIFVKEEIVNPADSAEGNARKRRSFLAD